MSPWSRYALLLTGFLLLLNLAPATIAAQTTADTETAFDAAIDYIQDAEPTAGPFGGAVDLVHGDLKNLSAGIQVAGFYAESGFLTPTNPPTGFWLVGICFWVDPEGNCYEAYIVSDGSTVAWDVGYSEPSGAFESLATGEVVNLDLEPGATNYIGLYVAGSTGIITVNSYSAEGTFELPTSPLAGDIELRVGFSAQDTAETGIVPLETFDFVVWDLAGMTATTAQPSDHDAIFNELKSAAQSQPSLAGPFQDAILQGTGSFNSYEAGVQVSDLYATVTFNNPTDTSVPLDIGFGINYTGLDSEVRLIVESTGDWFAAIGPSAEFASGTGAVLNAGPSASNQLEVIAQGTTGYLAVNGAVVAQIDLPADRAVGDVFVASGFYGPNSVDQRLVPFQDFQVWALQAPAVTAHPTAASGSALAPSTETAFADLKAQAQAGPSAGGPYNDTITQSSTALPFPSAGISYTDLYATVTFANPADTAQPWDIGIAIRYTGEDNEPRVILQSNGEWFVSFGSAEPTVSGQAQFDNAPQGLNSIEIVAQGGVGYVAINGIVVTEIDLSQVVRPGDVFISTGFFSNNVVDGRTLSYQAFDVWQILTDSGATTAASPSLTLSPNELIAGPYAGALIEREGAVDAAPAGVSTSDFFATVTFVVPTDASVPWEATLAFRDGGQGTQYRLTIVSTGEWWLSIGEQAPSVTGALSNLNTTPGQENRLDLVVEGTNGTASLNGVDFATLDLSAVSGPGDLWIAAGTFTANTLPGRITQYRAFEVWSLA